MNPQDSFSIVHTKTKQIFSRDRIFINPHYTSTRSGHSTEVSNRNASLVEAFHKGLPNYSQTPLVSIPDLAQELGVAHVFIKDESQRFGLPSFKILGASWAIHCAICEKVGLPTTVSIKEAGLAARHHNVRLVTCSAGNWGRAVARMGSYLGIKVLVYVFKGVSGATKDLIRDEGANVVTVDGSYDDSIQAAIEKGEEQDALLVMDTSWDGFEKIPQWVVDGYSGMLLETDRQIKQACGRVPSICAVPVGVGSIAQAVVAHYTSKEGNNTQNITVESEAAPCLMESLRNGEIVPLDTGETILPPLNCGTVSTLAWPILRNGVYATVAVSDLESHKCLRYLAEHGIAAGPCGGATLAAIRRLHKAGLIGQDQDAVVVLFSTEGAREYTVPCST